MSPSSRCTNSLPVSSLLLLRPTLSPQIYVQILKMHLQSSLISFAAAFGFLVSHVVVAAPGQPQYAGGLRGRQVVNATKSVASGPTDYSVSFSSSATPSVNSTSSVEPDPTSYSGLFSSSATPSVSSTSSSLPSTSTVTSTSTCHLSLFFLYLAP